MLRWTKDDIDKLRSLYTDLSIQDLMKEFPGRTEAAIYSKAYKLGLERDFSRATEEELNTLRQLGGKLVPREIKKYIPNRSTAWIANRLYVAGIKTDKRRRWTSDEDDILQKNPELSAEMIRSIYLQHRTVPAIQTRRLFLKQRSNK